MKKLLIIGGAIVAVFILIVVLSNKADETKLKDNPYGTEKLSKSTIDLIGNENYNNIVLPDTLFKKIEDGESVTAYYFHPECQYCMQMTPVLMPIAKEMDVNVQQYNMMEFAHKQLLTESINGQHSDNTRIVKKSDGWSAHSLRKISVHFSLNLKVNKYRTKSKFPASCGT